MTSSKPASLTSSETASDIDSNTLITCARVDEYQDINPAQERSIELLATPPVELCVVGNDEQSIYQWRGTDVENIVKFAERYRGRGVM